MSEISMEQGKAAWIQARLGKCTASRVRDVVKRTTAKKFTAARETYMGQLLAERLTGKMAPNFVSAEMLWGTEQEPAARHAYQFWTNREVQLVGFVPHPRFSQAGASPDGLVGADGLLEIKCPKTTTHIETILGQVAPEDNVPQMQFQMACTGRAWCDFVSYDPRMPDEMKLFVRRVLRDEDYIKAMEDDVSTFLEEIDAKLAALAQLYELQAAA